MQISVSTVIGGRTFTASHPQTLREAVRTARVAAKNLAAGRVFIHVAGKIGSVWFDPSPTGPKMGGRIY